MKKVKVPVYLQAMATRFIGDVEIESLEDFNDAAFKLLEETGMDISANISNDFDMDDSEIQPIDQEDFDFYKNEQLNKPKGR